MIVNYEDDQRSPSITNLNIATYFSRMFFFIHALLTLYYNTHIFFRNVLLTLVYHTLSHDITRRINDILFS